MQAMIASALCANKQKEFYRFIKEIKLSVYNFVQINDYTTRTAALTGFPRSSNENYLRTALYLL